jgi:cell fate regulator YaaT (PSP1 superfamily)
MCCLLFEHEGYLQAREKLPERGEHVQTPQGPARVTDIDLLREQITVELEEGKELTLDVEVLEASEQERRPSETRGGDGGGDGADRDDDGGRSG